MIDALREAFGVEERGTVVRKAARLFESIMSYQPSPLLLYCYGEEESYLPTPHGADEQMRSECWRGMGMNIVIDDDMYDALAEYAEQYHFSSIEALLYYILTVFSPPLFAKQGESGCVRIVGTQGVVTDLSLQSLF